MMHYNICAERRYGGPVQSIAVLLRREARATATTGRVRRVRAGGTVYLAFEYEVVPLWELPFAPLLSGGLGTVPLALLTDDAAPVLPAVLDRIGERIRAETSGPTAAAEVWTACDLLMGLRYDAQEIGRLFAGVHGMEESTTYQAIMVKGEIRGRRNAIREEGEQRFGPPSPDVLAVLDSITDVRRLRRIEHRVETATDWNDLLATP
jgi:hypothetical protein